MPPLPPPLLPTSTPPTLITQGAESHLYRTAYLLPTLPAALKHRPPKPYRHATLDARLTRHRLLSEARALVRCRRAGLRVPALYALDAEAGWVLMEWIAGPSLRAGLKTWMKARDEDKEQQEGLRKLMSEVGGLVGAMHAAGVVHGDLTTSNLMLRPPPSSSSAPTASPSPLADQAPPPTPEGEVYLIDFGLATQSLQDEDRAVDLYVLERAFRSTHPSPASSSVLADGEADGVAAGRLDLFAEVLRAYGESFRGAKVVLRRLEDVRMRGRKRSMLG
ncbi:MAG: hypothetical protein M1832_003908 [Thelocarpon impressellum]|nr:MAG: hypothetical protein M1832_003908 [Thelocarpon impressellum]